MKIISKYKDYYDYLQGIYGIDNILTFDRRSKDPLTKLLDIPNDSNHINEFKFAICNQIYLIKRYKNKLYYTYEEILKFNKLTKEVTKTYGKYLWNPYNEEEWKKDNSKTIVNIKHRKPILLEIGHDVWTDSVLLSSFNFPKYISAHDMFINISAFIGYLVDNPPIKNNQTNLEKLDSHGFDRKKSFRHRK